MNGAEMLVKTLLAGGVEVCFANPGTSEMHFVAALDNSPKMRCVLGLFEGVVTGAADGYYRMADKPAATLLHLGPGLANGLANLHNAKKARSGILNVVGDHATGHLKLDAPLTSDITGLATPMSHWVRSASSADAVEQVCREGLHEASCIPGRIATLLLPADAAWSECSATNPVSSPVVPHQTLSVKDEQVVKAALAAKEGGSTLVLLGGRALRAKCTRLAGRVALATGCTVMSECYGARIERGAGRFTVPRLPYSVDAAVAILKRFQKVILVDARPPVAFFAYPNKPGILTAPGCEFIELASSENSPVDALDDLCAALNAHIDAPLVHQWGDEGFVGGELEPAGIARVIRDLIPENGIVVDESLTSGRGLDSATACAAPHDWLTGTGGSIGFALPVAIGAAVASPTRKVIALEGDGSGMYTLQSLWTMARENLDVTVVIFANRAYQILKGEFENVGAGQPGRRASDMLSLDRPDLEWTALARGMGMFATKVSRLDEFRTELAAALASNGPALIELLM
jgi:acetolactate synthase-1/2/3 large subunit